LVAIYEPLTTLYIYLPPLLAYGAWQFYQKRARVDRFFWLGYFYLYEMDHSLPFFSLFVTLAAYVWVLRQIERYVACRLCVMGMSTAVFYLLLVVVLTLYIHVVGIDFVINYRLFLGYTILDLVVLYAF